MMEFIICLSIILIYASMLTIILKENISKTILISIVEIILIIYICGLLDNLQLGVKIVELLAIIQLLIIIFNLCNKKDSKDVKEILKRIITPELFIYLSLCGIVVCLNKNRIFEDYDEFTHWGRIIKNMFLTNNFGLNQESVITFSEYPPVTAIFQYMFLNIKQVYSESTVIIAQNILYFSIIISLFSNMLKKENIKKSLVFLVIIVFLPMIFNKNFYLDILVDGLLGILFAMALYCSFEKEDNLFFKYLTIFSYFILLCLMKTTGIALAILAVLIIFIKQRKSKKDILALIWVILAVSGLTSLWYIKADNGIKRWDFDNYIEVTNKTEEEEKNIMEGYIKALFEKTSITEQKYTMVTMILFLLFLGIYVNSILKDKDYKYYSIWMFVSLVIYLFFTLITYATIFDTSEASRLFCFERYHSIILVALAIFFIIGRFKSKEKIKNLEIFVIIFILLILFPYDNIKEKYINSENYIEYSKLNRTVFTQISRYNDILTNKDKILFITGSGPEGEDVFAMSQYEITPQKLHDSIKDVESEEELEKILKEGEFTHVYIYRMDDEVEEKVKNIFKDKMVTNDYLYEVIEKEDDIILQIVL